MLLTDNLQRVGDAAGHDACVGYGCPAGDDACQRGRFEDEHQHAVDDCAGDELNQRQAHAVKIFDDVLDADNLCSEAEGADERV